MMAGHSNLAKIAAGILLAISLCGPARGQRRDQEQRRAERQENRREVPRPARPERALPRENLRMERPFGGRFPSRPGYVQRSPRNMGGYSQGSSEVAHPPIRSARPGNALPAESMRHEVARPPVQAERRIETSPSSQQGMHREVPRPPGQYRNGSPGFAQEQRRVAQPPASIPRKESAAFSDRGSEVPRPPQAGAQPRVVPRPPMAGQKHGGDWLRSHQNLSLADQQKALQSDPQFRKLPAQQQQQLVNRLQKFNSLPPEEQQRRLSRIETWEHLTPQQKTQARQLAQQWKQLSPDRQRMMKTAIGDLRAMPPEQRESVLESERFKGMFSDQERKMLRETTKLPLAPAQAPVPRPPE
jgi:Protein of unknown function (DUF3106)